MDGLRHSACDGKNVQMSGPWLRRHEIVPLWKSNRESNYPLILYYKTPLQVSKEGSLQVKIYSNI
jgi:hypothetical protein